MVYKAISNIYFSIRISKINNLYISYLRNEHIDMAIYKRELMDLFKRADVQDSYIPTVEPAGYGLISTYKASVFKNFPNQIQSHASVILNMIDEAKGVFRCRLFETFNPIYWIEFILFLPKKMLQYLGVDSEKIVVKVFQLLWWICTPLGVLFRDSISKHIKDILVFIR